MLERNFRLRTRPFLVFVLVRCVPAPDPVSFDLFYLRGCVTILMLKGLRNNDCRNRRTGTPVRHCMPDGHDFPSDGSCSRSGPMFPLERRVPRWVFRNQGGEHRFSMGAP